MQRGEHRAAIVGMGENSRLDGTIAKRTLPWSKSLATAGLQSN